MDVSNLEESSVCDERKSCWGWIHAVSMLMALALHGMLLYIVASRVKPPLPYESTFTVDVRSEKASPPPEAPRLTAEAQQAAATPPSTLKNQAKAARHQARPEISASEQPLSPAPSVVGEPISVVPTTSETSTEENTPPPAISDAGVAMGGELSFFCPVRPTLIYPHVSRKMGEEGTVILHVEWDQEGQITSSRVQRSSGFRRLDEAALTTIHNWRCNPARQDGVPVRAVAVQPFRFQLHEE